MLKKQKTTVLCDFDRFFYLKSAEVGKKAEHSKCLMMEELNNPGEFSQIQDKLDSSGIFILLSTFPMEYPGENITLIMDGAGWHKSKDLVVPENITIIYLPPYSPELNPVERLWLYIKKSVLYNKIYDTLEELEKAVIAFINQITNQTIVSICNFNYMHS